MPTPSKPRRRELPAFPCDNCMYFVPKPGLTTGRCRRHALGTGGTGWPVVVPTDFCGDHKLAD